jgi:hypothetical protein
MMANRCADAGLPLSLSSDAIVRSVTQSLLTALIRVIVGFSLAG